MFCNKPKNVTRSVPAKRNRKRKKKSSYPYCDKRAKQSDSFSQSSSQTSLATAMSTWAQTYTEAATWQLKHQVAYWKARAKALEYENRVLHDAIKNNYLKQTIEPASSRDEEDDSSEADDENVEEESVDEDEQDEEDFEVSEEFIEFLRQNAKYKEDARKEKERLRTLREAENKEIVEEAEPVESSEEKQARYIETYGDSWERIMALETSLLCDFIDQCDKEKPDYWPNIPFNFL